jgi:hypothetical protein
LKPWQHQQWCIPEVSAEFVATMEDVLDLYAQPYDPARPQVCFDEKPVVLHAEARPSVPPAPGRPARHDYEYVRQGTANLFVMVEPQAGWRHIAATEHRTQQDYAVQLRWLADERYPDAVVIRVVEDNLNIHGPAALYATFPPEEARRLVQRFEFHPTPKHASWLNMAEIEISIVERGALSRPCPDLDTLRQRVATQVADRNARHCRIRWQFTATEARLKLHDLYPVRNTQLD